MYTCFGYSLQCYVMSIDNICVKKINKNLDTLLIWNSHKKDALVYQMSHCAGSNRLPIILLPINLNVNF